ncbi:uncharacterized protein LOC130714634 [Lotus japonicus]|uniref:uncharacterized protein LOC130714634 n=1 Tax=Lotus japonicus TaxID=34305 RepID=UPI00258CFFF3|nr:uncharacterized protein LOC130714634 [Lotus japonicus]
MNPPTFGHQPFKILPFSATSPVVLGGILARKDKKSDLSSFVRPPEFPFSKESNSEGASQAKENDASFWFEDFIIFMWNVRGAMNANAKLALKEFIRVKKPDLVILVETHCQFQRTERFWKSQGYIPGCIVEAIGHSGGIWVLIQENSKANISVFDVFAQAITFDIAIGAYAWTWRALRFASVLENCDMLDLEAKGGQFTWHRMERGALRISKRLDRALADSDWRLAFPEAFVEVQTRMHSDHNPIIVRCNVPSVISGERPFRFLAAWVNHEAYRSVVTNAWRGPGGDLREKISRVQADSLSFNKHTFGNIFQRKRHVEGRLRGVQRDLDIRVTSSMVQLETQLQHEYRDILRNEELLWFQKSREQWVRFGDRNTAFFHTQTVVRRKRNKIHRLQLRDGTWSSDEEVLKCEAEDFFQDLFCTAIAPTLDQFQVNNLPIIPEDCRRDLLAPVTKIEVKRALMSMKSFKAPGPDGFQPVFFKQYWDIVGEDIWRVVSDAFSTGTINPSLAETLIVLIPKVDVPTQMKEFRPISLCNVVYKIITKVVVSRIRPYLNQFIGPLQSSFVPGRGTTDNAILAQEVVHYLDHSLARKGSMAFKIDLEKNNKLSWGFLEETIRDFGFPDSICRLIMCCVSSAKLALLWNGTRLPWFSPVRGLRQGDPMSPYLFVMCMEKLSVRIQNTVDASLWQPITLSRGGPPLSHIFFADDVMLFCKATTTQVELVADILDSFGAASGLVVSAAKSKALCSKGVPAATRNSIANVCPIRVVRNLGKYLGFPMASGRVSHGSFNFIIDQISRRLAGWKCRLLNTAGRVCLARAVITAIPTYYMQVLWMPRRTINLIDKAARNFIWSSSSSTPGTHSWHRVKWDVVTQPRIAGGLGVRDSSHANTSLLGKLVWSFLQESYKLWTQVLAHKYLGSKSILEVTAAPNSSPLWKGILKARDVLRDGFAFKLGNGATSIWYKDWSGYGPLANNIPYVHITDTNMALRDIIINGDWNPSSLYTILPPLVQQKMLAVAPVIDIRLHDHWIWKFDSQGIYSAAGAYSWLINANAQMSLTGLDTWRWIWKIKVPEKIRVFIWLCMHDAIQVNNLRFRCKLASSPSCSRCQHSMEDILHCLRDCRFAREIWNRLNALTWPRFLVGSVQAWIKYQVCGPHGSLFATALWGIWRWRNNAILGDKSWNAISTVNWISTEHHDYSSFLSSDLSMTLGMGGGAFWRAPPAGKFKLNTDGAFDLTGARMGMGAYSGGNPITAEIGALKHGLVLLWNANIRKAICEVDCLEIVKALSKNRYQFHEYASELLDLKLLLDRDWCIELTHISRDANAAADCLAGIGGGLQCPIEYLEAPPQQLAPILARDLLAL